ncbi:MAG: DEAD/DEAH box helicase [Acidobacteriota bacterium]|nr:DEAD/DEAH box helicase [Acidobacteriota bacterium]
MEQNRVNALAEFLKVVPEKIRIEGKKHRNAFNISDKGQRVKGTITIEGLELEQRFDFDPKVGRIVGAFCSCRKARKGSICDHIVGLAGQLVDDHLTFEQGRNSLEFLDKHFNSPAFQNAQFRLSVELVMRNDALEPEIMFHKYIKEGTFGVGRKFTANDSYKFTHGDTTDQNILDYVRNFRQIFFYSNYTPAQRYTWGFWLTLLGHPRISFEERPVDIVTAPINLELTESAGRYELKISHDMNLAPDLQYFEVDGGLLGFSRSEGRLFICQVDKFRSDILMEVSQHRPLLSRSDLVKNLPRLEKLQSFFDIKLPSELEGIIQKIEPSLIILLDLEVGRGLTLSPRIRYEGASGRVVPGSHGQYLATGSDMVIEREQEKEKVLYRDFLDLFPYEDAPDRNYEIQIADLERAVAVVEWLKEARWELEWLRQEPKIHQISNVQGLRVQVDANAWLKIHLMADDKTFSIQHFPQDDYHLAGTRYVAIGDGEWLQIDRQLRQQMNQFKMAVVQEDKAMKLKNAALAVLSEMKGVEWDGDKSWMDKIKEWRGQGSDKYTPHESLNVTLRNYQLDGYRWLRRLSELGVGACLADDMGLGKTIQALAVIHDRISEGPVLVVAPASVCYNWKEEIERFSPDQKPLLYSEGRRAKNLSRLKNGDILIISYALVLKDFKRLSEVTWGTLVLDEAQFIKNAISQTAIAVSQLSRKWTLALTGTPLENHLGELWSIFRMLNPELLGTWEHFRKAYVSPIEKGQDSQKLENLRRLIRPFILRRTKQNVLADLPERSDIHLKVELGDAQRTKYEQERNRILSQLDEADEGNRFKLLAAITRLRQIACHPALCEDKYKGGSAKLKLFSELAEELVSESHRVLVFSQFTSFLSLIARELNRLRIPHVMMTGDTPVKHRHTIIKRFQEGEVPIFLVSLRAGGTGLNLTNANYVIHMDPWWNPAVEEQATDRAHRIGQTRAVTVYRLVAGNTIEEAILNIHDRKRGLVQSLLDGKDTVGKLSIEDLISLIKGEEEQ